jgi:hypothetical protein
MGLSSADKRPSGMTVDEAYEAIRAWYQANRHRAPDHSKPVIDGIVPARQATLDQKVAVFREVIARNMEWAYHEDDGQYKMAAYALAGLEAAGAQS